MATATQRPELIAIVGPTASGKSDLALKIAENFNGEIIAADSRTIYKGMDIGTAKSSKLDQKWIKHWGLDLVEPGERFTAHQFQKYARSAIKDIQKRGKLPILVGGTGLYIDGLLYNFEFLPERDLTLRKKLESMSVEELQTIIEKNSFAMPVNLNNKRHLIRTIETRGASGTRTPKPLKGTLIIGLMPPDEILLRKINQRVQEMFNSGLVNETKQLVNKYGEAAVLATAGAGYKPLIELINDRISQKEAKRLFEKAHWQYARRQRTWFRRNKFIQWFETREEAYICVTKALNNRVA